MSKFACFIVVLAFLSGGCITTAKEPSIKVDVRLDELTPVKMKSATAAKQTQVNKNCTGGPLEIGKVTYEHGLGERSGAELVYEIKPDYGRFTALVGIDSQAGNKGSIMAKVFVDNVLFGNSSYLIGGSRPWQAQIDIPQNSKQLKIVIEDGKDGNANDDANIVNAGFILRKNLPEIEKTSKKPVEETDFFNGKDIEGWKGDRKYWSVADGAIVAKAEKRVPKNEFLFSPVPVRDFYLSVTMKQTPFAGNSGIQIRSQVDRNGQAIGYQADAGKGWWGKLYHEHSGRGLLDKTGEGLKHVKKEDWNHYEILCVGHNIWTAINGRLSTAMHDPIGELEGFIAFQLHSGGPQTIIFKEIKLVHNPKIQLAGMDEKQLNAALRTTKK